MGLLDALVPGRVTSPPKVRIELGPETDDPRRQVQVILKAAMVARLRSKRPQGDVNGIDFSAFLEHQANAWYAIGLGVGKRIARRDLGELRVEIDLDPEVYRAARCYLLAVDEPDIGPY